MLRAIYVGIVVLTAATAPAVEKPPGVCASCAAVANELSRQMREEWGHLQLDVRDRKRTLAKEAVQEQACGEAVEQILQGICNAVKDYASASSRDGVAYYQKVHDPEEGVIVIRGSVTVRAGGEEELSRYCERMMHMHEDRLAAIMADGTDDLVTDLCIATTRECDAAAVARIPAEGLPPPRPPPR